MIVVRNSLVDHEGVRISLRRIIFPRLLHEIERFGLKLVGNAILWGLRPEVEKKAVGWRKAGDIAKRYYSHTSSAYIWGLMYGLEKTCRTDKSSGHNGSLKPDCKYTVI